MVKETHSFCNWLRYLLHLKTPSHKTRLGGTCSGFFFFFFLHFFSRRPDFQIKYGLTETLLSGETSPKRRTHPTTGISVYKSLKFGGWVVSCVCVCVCVCVWPSSVLHSSTRCAVLVRNSEKSKLFSSLWFCSKHHVPPPSFPRPVSLGPQGYPRRVAASARETPLPPTAWSVRPARRPANRRAGRAAPPRSAAAGSASVNCRCPRSMSLSVIHFYSMEL